MGASGERGIKGEQKAIGEKGPHNNKWLNPPPRGFPRGVLPETRKKGAGKERTKRTCYMDRKKFWFLFANQ